MSTPILGHATETLLREQHPDPFVAAAIWRLYVEYPTALDPTLRTDLEEANKADLAAAAATTAHREAL